jgi:hypothetical protein
MQAKDKVYDPFWMYESEEWERKTLNRVAEVKRNAINQDRTRSDEKHEEEVRKEEGEKSVLRIDQQGKPGNVKVARVKKKGFKDLRSRTWVHRNPKEKVHGTKKDDSIPRSDASQEGNA